MTINNIVNLQVADVGVSGEWLFSGALSAVTPNKPIVLDNFITDPLPPPSAGEMRILSQASMQVASYVGNVSISTVTAGNINLNPVDDLTMNAAGSLNANFDTLISFNCLGATNFQADNFQFTTTSGAITLNSAGNISITSSSSNVNIVATTNIQLTSDFFNINSLGTTPCSITTTAASLSLSSTDENFFINSNNGNISIISGVGSTNGSIFIQSNQQSINITCTTGTLTCSQQQALFSSSQSVTITAGTQVQITADDDVSILATSTNASFTAPLGSLGIDANIINFGTSYATAINFCRVGFTTTFGGLQILSDLPGSAPVGSVAVLWDPVGKQLYHV